MVSCCVPNCRSTQGRTAGVSFHQFPRHLWRTELWLKAIGRDNFRINGNSPSTVVCSRHFRPEDYMPDVKNRVLRPRAVPSIFPICPDDEVKNRKMNKKGGKKKSETSLRKSDAKNINFTHAEFRSSIESDCTGQSVENNLSNSQLLPKQEPNPEPYETPPTSHVLLQNIKTEVILPDEYDTSEQQQSQHYHTPDATTSTSVPPETVLPTPIVLWGSTENPPGVDSTCSSIAQTVEKEQQHEQPFKKSRVELLNSTEDRFDVFAKNVALKLREMDKTQRILVEKIINDALFEGEMGMLTRHHRLVDMSKNKDFLTNEEGV